jgi:uncharacterized coiled-coil DUF342 family protein
MMDTSERLGRVEERVDSLAAEVGELRAEVGELRAEVGELRAEVGELRAEVGELRAEVGELRAEVGELRKEVGGLREQVHLLAIRTDDNSAQIRLIAEVQVHHGQAIEEIRADLKVIHRDMAPLRDVYNLMRQVAANHEQRIESLEKWAAGR